MTAATLRGPLPAAAPAKKAATSGKGFWARLIQVMVEARQAEVERKLAPFLKDGRPSPLFYI